MWNSMSRLFTVWDCWESRAPMMGLGLRDEGGSATQPFLTKSVPLPTIIVRRCLACQYNLVIFLPDTPH